MQAERKKILLFLDNATCHVDPKLKNVKVVFFPANTTSACQPLDQGIIKSFKVFYRQLILKRLISMLDECGDRMQVPTLSKNINVLDALIATAWKGVSVDIVTNCLKKAGFRNGEVNVNQY